MSGFGNYIILGQDGGKWVPYIPFTSKNDPRRGRRRCPKKKEKEGVIPKERARRDMSNVTQLGALDGDLVEK